MNSQNVLLTGGSGNLGSRIICSGFANILAPPHKELDVCDLQSIERFFYENPVDAVIHCAAIARLQEVEKDPSRALEVNVLGTANLVRGILSQKRDIRFIYISTDGVYAGTEGNYSETDSTIPYSKYGWTKLGGECAAKILPNNLIIRTSFYSPHKINFDTAPSDAFTSKLPIEEVAKEITFLLNSGFVGTVNVGGERQSYYDLYRKVNPNISPCSSEDMQNLAVKLPKDCSMDSSLLRRIKSL